MIKTIKRVCVQQKIKKTIKKNEAGFTEIETKGLKLRISNFNLNEIFLKKINLMIQDIDFISSIKLTLEIKKIRNQDLFNEDQITLLKDKSSPDIYKSFLLISTDRMIGVKEKDFLLKALKDKLLIDNIDIFDYKINPRPVTKSYRNRKIITYKTKEDTELNNIIYDIKNVEMRKINSKVLLSLNFTKEHVAASISTINCEIPNLDIENSSALSSARFANSLAFYKFIELKDNYIKINFENDIRIESNLNYFFLNKLEIVENINLESKIVQILGPKGAGKTKFIDDYINFKDKDIFLIFDVDRYPNHYKKNTIFNPSGNFFVEDKKIRFTDCATIEEINKSLNNINQLDIDNEYTIIIQNIDTLKPSNEDIDVIISNTANSKVIIESNKKIKNSFKVSFSKNKTFQIDNKTYTNHYRRNV